MAFDGLRLLFGMLKPEERAALQAYEQDHVIPAGEVETIADEPTRHVVRVKFRPSGHRHTWYYRFYAVDKTTLAAELILDDSDYPPADRLKLR